MFCCEREEFNDILGIADNLIAYQNIDGGWPKNIDWLAILKPDSVINNLSERYRQSTFDNINTYPQIEYLAETFMQSGIEKYRLAAVKGLNFILNQEYPKGGWRGWDANVITFNDGVMTGIMNLLLDIEQGDKKYEWIDKELRNRLSQAYQRGLKVIIKSQIIINGERTAWCQQHDFETYSPVQGRSYEHPSVTARESCDVILFLMRISNPDSSIITAIESAVNWLQKVQITGYRYSDVPINERPYHETTINFDREFVPDYSARPVWARYYDLKNSKPFLSQSDGKIVYQLSEISFDRRVGYEWYGFWPEKVLKAFEQWKSVNRKK
ncbi:MAG: pectate lyase [Calditrichaceae bacterium]